MLSFVAFFLVFSASILYLYNRNVQWDIWAICSAEVGVIFCTLVLITGSIWAKPAWNVWWTWDPRLTTLLMLWCMYVAYLMLRKLLNPGDRTSNIAAVFGIISFINVPITFFAIRMWRSIHPVTRGISPPMLYTLLISFGAMTLFFILLLRLRVRVEQSLHTSQELLFHTEDI
jgi:heme exporter protein C